MRANKRNIVTWILQRGFNFQTKLERSHPTPSTLFRFSVPVLDHLYHPTGNLLPENMGKPEVS